MRKFSTVLAAVMLAASIGCGPSYEDATATYQAESDILANLIAQRADRVQRYEDARDKLTATLAEMESYNRQLRGTPAGIETEGRLRTVRRETAETMETAKQFHTAKLAELADEIAAQRVKVGKAKVARDALK